MVSDAEMTKMGASAFEELQKTTPIVRDKAMNAYVRCVADAVVEASRDVGQAPESWQVTVFEDSTANAFALPGGKIGVHSGLLKVARTQDQLAAVLGHEVAHVLARHGGERASQALASEAGLSLAKLVTPENKTTQSLVMGVLGVGVQYGVLMPYGRAQESEADAIGLTIMARAGFTPEESVALWQNMNAAGGTKVPAFLSTHPSHDTRIRDLQAKMPAARQAFAEAQRANKNPRCGTAPRFAATP